MIAGGGSAGMAAGIMAARQGAKTLLLERQGMLGGMATTALVHSVCGLYRMREDAKAVYANPGFPEEFASALLRDRHADAPTKMGRLMVLPHHPTGFAQTADQIAQGESNLQIWFHTELTRVEEGTEGVEFEWSCRGTQVRACARSIVDASGDGTASVLAAKATEQTSGSKLQRPAYIFGLAGMPFEAFAEDNRLRVVHAIVEGVRSGALPKAAMGAQFRQIQVSQEVFCTVDLSGDQGDSLYDPLHPACLSRIDREGREIAGRLVEYLRTKVEGFNKCQVSQFPARAGVRESRRVITEHLLTGDELMRAQAFPDAIANAAWPIELRETARGPKWSYYEGEEPPQIPLGSLQVKGSDRFFVAGRCLGADHRAQAAIRVMGTCMATGQAVGIAAAIRAEDKPVSAEAIGKALECRAEPT